MTRFVLLVTVILSLFVCIPADAGPVCKAVKGAAKAAKVVKVVRVIRPLKIAKAVLPPWGK